MSDEAIRESRVETAKRASRQLRGTIAETLAAEASSHFGEDDVHLLKFHGTYQQDDRDARRRREEAAGKAWQFMIRVALPAGVLSAPQYLAFEQLADRYGNGTLRVTTRQGFQFHGVLKRGLKATIAAINRQLATTLAACGDVQRNVMGCAAPLADAGHREVQRMAQAIAAELRPRTNAYYEIWLDGERQVTTENEEPFYGTQYLPRKFKTAVGLGTDNCVDIYAHDVGLLAVLERGSISGYNLLVGGGLGMTHNKGDTFAHLAEPLAFLAPQHAVEAARAVAAIFRDHGNRADRKHARLKYLLADWGIERFRAEFQRRVSFRVTPPLDVPRLPWHDHLGRHRQPALAGPGTPPPGGSAQAQNHNRAGPALAGPGTPPPGGCAQAQNQDRAGPDGRWFYGVFIQSGRIADLPDQRLKAALHEILSRYQPGVQLTAQQNLLLTDLSQPAVDEAEQILRDHGVTPGPELNPVRRYSMACPALPTCGLAVAESERALPGILAQLEAELESLSLQHEPITVRMTGCPNGCARPYTADLAFVGRSLDLYHVYVGGGLAGDRVVDLYQANVRRADLLDAVRPLLGRWAAERQPGEGLGDFYQRIIGHTGRRTVLTGREEPTSQLVQLELVR
jgi:sulfite reductase beta subunit-like hemoprotein